MAQLTHHLIHFITPFTNNYNQTLTDFTNFLCQTGTVIELTFSAKMLHDDDGDDVDSDADAEHDDGHDVSQRNPDKEQEILGRSGSH